MTNNRLKQLVVIALATCLCGCGSGELSGVRGVVTVDENPVESGTISFNLSANPTGRGFGGVISSGKFELGGGQALTPGKYFASVQALKATGRMSNHPQKGPVAQMRTLDIADSPQEVEITSENAGNVTVNFHERK